MKINKQALKIAFRSKTIISLLSLYIYIAGMLLLGKFFIIPKFGESAYYVILLIGIMILIICVLLVFEYYYVLENVENERVHNYENERRSDNKN